MEKSFLQRLTMRRVKIYAFKLLTFKRNISIVKWLGSLKIELSTDDIANNVSSRFQRNCKKINL